MKHVYYNGLQLDRDGVRRAITGIAQGFIPEHRKRPSQEERDLATVMDCLDTHIVQTRLQLKDLMEASNRVPMVTKWIGITWRMALALSAERKPTC